MSEIRIFNKIQSLRGQYAVHNGRAYRINAVLKTSEGIALSVEYIDRKEERDMLTLWNAWDDKIARLEDIHPNKRED